MSKLIDCTKDDFRDNSGEIAHLHTSAHTSKAWPGGTLVIIRGTAGAFKKRCLIIIKAEQQSGFREEESTDEILLEYIENLILTPQARLYKIGVFIEISQDSKDETERSADDFSAYIFDSNIKAQDDSKAAQYFYSNFLGLNIPENSQQKTRDFYSYTKDFIAGSEVTDEEKLDLQQALYTYLKTDQSNTIKTSEFSEKYMNEKVQDDYLDYMENKSFPTNSIIKDLKLIKNKLKQRKVNFSSNVKIIAPAESFSEVVNILETSDEDTKISIKGHLISQE